MPDGEFDHYRDELGELDRSIQDTRDDIARMQRKVRAMEQRRDELKADRRYGSEFA
jgi:phage shock protein A